MSDMNQKVKEKTENIMNLIKSSYEYQRCIKLKIKMNQNKELKEQIEEVKKLQKEYLKTGLDLVKERLQEQQNKLNQIPIYYEYNLYLEQVNEKLEWIKASLNEYFIKKLNDNIMEKHEL